MSGVKCADLSLFRNASNARKVEILHTGGDIYIASAMPSDMAVLWGENFGSKERKFLRELLGTEKISFSLKDTYQIHLRTLYNPASMSSAITVASGLRRQGKFALLLHDLKGELTTSWTFTKFIRPLYRKGFSIIAVDLPGFGKSSVAQVCACPVSRWQEQQAHLIAKVMEELSIAKCQLLAVGDTCGILFRMLQSSPHRIANEHVLINPVFDRNVLFAHLGTDPPPGAKAGWQAAIKAKQQASLIETLRTTATRMWCIFDRDGKHTECRGGRVAPTKELQADWQNAFDTHEMLSEACKNEFIQANLKVTEITKQDLCEAQCGKKIPVRMFVPSRHLKASVARFMARDRNLPWEDLYQPHHVAFSKKGRRRSSSGTRIGSTGGLDDESDEDSDEESSQSFHQGLPATRALAMMPSQTMREEDVNNQDFEVTRLAEENFRKQVQKEKVVLALYDSKDAGEMSRLRNSASEGTIATRSSIGRSSIHSLSAAATIANSMLKRSGASANPRIVTAEAVRDMKSMNWTKVPYEADLSYGVRKMYNDAFEASAETYKEEQDKEYERVKMQERKALRAARILNR